MLRFVLGSQSPRRRTLLQLLNCPLVVVAADVDEQSVTELNPAVNALLTAKLKAVIIREGLDRTAYAADTILVTADTTVAIDGRILGKPKDVADAWQMLQALRGCTHQVHTGLMLVNLATGQELADVHTAVVTMRPYTDAEIAAYIATGDPLDKAGAYGIQHPQFRPVAALEGCFTGVMGLSICHLVQTLLRWDILVPVTPALVRAHQGYLCPLLPI